MIKTKRLLVDLNGTLHIGNTVTPKAVEALETLKRDKSVNVKFVTNTTKESRIILLERLIKIGFNITLNDIVSSLWAARQLVSSRGLKPFFLVDNDAMAEFKGFIGYDEDSADSVVVGLAPDKFNRFYLNIATRILLKSPDHHLIAIHDAKYYKTEDGGLSMGPGPFVKTLEYATNRKAVVVGKPSADFYKMALEGASDSEDVYMIGDDVKQDIEGAQKLGIKGFLVKTGKYREGDELKITPPPFKTVDNFSQAVEDILKL